MHDRDNSVIFKNSEEQHLLDLSALGSLKANNKEIRIKQDKHFFQIGDALFFDVRENKFSKALAINNINCEVCGIVSEVPSDSEFIILTEGYIKTDRYKYAEGLPLYLSEVIPGFLMSIEPTHISKQAAVQTANGIKVDIQMGYYLKDNEIKISLEPYTKEELDDIILNIKG